MVHKMNEYVKKTVNGNEYLFINSFRGNRSGFVHESKLYKNNRLIGENKIQYYNRTWERYTYQSVMKGIVSTLLDDCENDYKTAWKEEHGIKRLTKEKRMVMENDFWKNQPKNYAELAELGAML